MTLANHQKGSSAKVHYKTNLNKRNSISLVVNMHRIQIISQKLPVPNQWVKFIPMGRYDLREFN
jgi:hypothetical protein